MSALLRLEGVTKRFGGVTAVNNVSLEIRQGEIAGIIGPNGSGKTTLFATVSGFLKPDAGRILFDGHSIAGWTPSRVAALGIARTFQIVQPFGALTVLDNVTVGALRGGRETLKAAREQAAQVVKFLGLEAIASRPAAGLTIAERKRLEVGKALATKPRLLLLDEVMAGLRPTEVDQVIETVRRIREQGVTIVLIEHLMRAVLALSETLYVLREGAVLAHGTPSEVVRRAEVVDAYFGHARSHA
jgi:branched-chain amino acid transport system ATP-binding protein